MAFEKDTNWELVKMIFAGLLMFICACGAAAWVAYNAFVKQDEVALQHETWTQVPARVYECQIYKAAPRYRNQSSHEWVNVRYTYSVNGVRYDSDELGSMDKERMKMFRDASGKSYIMGSSPADFLPADLCCYVNPNNPHDVKLFTDAEHSPWWWTLLLLCLWGGVSLFAFTGLVMAFKEAGRRIGRFFRR